MNSMQRTESSCNRIWTDLGNITDNDIANINLETDKLFIYDASAARWFRIGIEELINMAGGTGIDVVSDATNR